MKRRISITLFMLLALPFFTLGFGPTSPPAPKNSSPSPAQRLQINQNYGKLPLAFEVNEGQSDPQVRFLARGRGYTLFLTPAEAVLGLHGGSCKASSRSKNNIVRMRIVGGNRLCKVEGLEKLPGVSNYFIGNDPSKWRSNVTHYAKVRLKEVYPGVDMVYYGNQGRLEYDFVVKPGADPKVIQLALEGTKENEIQAGNLVLKLDGNSKRDLGSKVVFKAPKVYQERDGKEEIVRSRYVVSDKSRVGFVVEGYDRKRDLVIDPQLDYSTYLGGSQDYGGALGQTDTTAYTNGKIAVDGSGNAYLTGDTFCINFPVSGGAYETTNNFVGGNCVMAFVTEISPSGGGGADLVYSTYLGGTYVGGANNVSVGRDIKVDPSGNIYVAGQTAEVDFPTTTGAFQTAYGTKTGGATWNIFVAKLNPAASGAAQLVYSTFVGAQGDDLPSGMALDPSNVVYVTGQTTSASFPTSPGAYQTAQPSATTHSFVFKLNPAGAGASDLVYSTYLGGTTGSDIGDAICLDSSKNICVVGHTNSGNFPTTAGAYSTSNPSAPGDEHAYISKIDPAGGGNSDLLYSTYLGGTTPPTSIEASSGVGVDGSNNIYVCGMTSSSTFPTTGGALMTSYSGWLDGFFAKLNPALSGNAQLTYCSFLGGNKNTYAYAIAVNGNGDAYITGETNASDFPTTPGAYKTNNPTSIQFAFIAEMNPSGNGGADLIYSTYFGGGAEIGGGIALDSTGNVYITGSTTTGSYPTTSGAFQTSFQGSKDAFFAKFDSSAFATITPTGTPTGTITSTPTSSPTSTPTNTASATPTNTPTPTTTNTSTATLTNTPSNTPLNTFTATNSPTNSPTLTPTNSPTATASNTPSLTATNTPLATATPSPTNTPGATNTSTATPTPAVTNVVIGVPYPNPTGPGPVLIPLQFPAGSTVEWSVFTTAFRKILDIPQPVAGTSAVLSWDLKDTWGVPVANGLYYLRVQVTGPVKTSNILKVLAIR